MTLRTVKDGIRTTKEVKEGWQEILQKKVKQNKFWKRKIEPAGYSYRCSKPRVVKKVNNLQHPDFFHKNVTQDTQRESMTQKKALQKVC